jgi:chemotaxis protein CheX
VTLAANFECVPLPEIMDLKAATPLALRILTLRGKPVAFDASRVQKLGGLCLQVLLSARLTWGADKISLTVIEPSANFQKSLEIFGVSKSLFS